MRRRNISGIGRRSTRGTASDFAGIIALLLILLPSIGVFAAELESASIRVDGRGRDYHFHAPMAVDAEKPMGVVFALHGGAGRAGRFAGYLNFDEFADRRNLLIVYPQGHERHWNDGRPDGRYEAHKQDIDDVGFLRAVLDALESRFPIDRRRVYVAGISNGGMMALRLACEADDVFAAVAVVTASFPVAIAESCDPSRPVPVLLMNGTDDPLVPYDGGQVRFGRRELGAVRSTADTVARWVALNGCDAEVQVRALPDIDANDHSRITVERRLPCRDGTEVTLYRVEGGGHTWPGRPQYLPRFIIGGTNRDIDGTRHILDFFDRHALPNR